MMQINIFLKEYSKIYFAVMKKLIIIDLQNLLT